MHVLRHILPKTQASSYVWQPEAGHKFEELIISWNALRPKRGVYHIYASVKFEQWTPWIKYASWGSKSQQTYQETVEEGRLSAYQDVILVKAEQKPSQCRIRVEAEGDASLEDFHRLYVCGSLPRPSKIVPIVSLQDSVMIPLHGISQMSLRHPRCRSLCSPTSVTAVVQSIMQTKNISPLVIAENVRDHTFDIYGNWILNTAHAYAAMDGRYAVWVQRMDGFDGILQSLKGGFPIIVSVRGPLPGSALPYEQGHLIVVRGYDADSAQVLCMDPAFPSDEETLVEYDLHDFLAAWERRGRIAYLLEKVVTPNGA